MAVTFDDVLAMAPQLANTPPAVQTATRDLAADRLGPGASDRRLTLMWAHVLTLVRQAQTSGGGGQIVSAAAGAVSVTFSQSPTDDELRKTIYGELYIAETKRTRTRKGTVFA